MCVLLFLNIFQYFAFRLKILMVLGTSDDYVLWLAHSDDISDPKDGCMLGYKEKFQRLKKDSICWNGRDYEVTTHPTPCECTLDDFLW